MKDLFVDLGFDGAAEDKFHQGTKVVSFIVLSGLVTGEKLELAFTFTLHFAQLVRTKGWRKRQDIIVGLMFFAVYLLGSSDAVSMLLLLLNGFADLGV
jgi:hypothetical protein